MAVATVKNNGGSDLHQRHIVEVYGDKTETGGLLVQTVHLSHISPLHRLSRRLVVDVVPHRLSAGQDFLLVSS